MKARPLPEGCIESLKAELKRARAEGVPALERVLCVWLRAALGLRADQVATAIGWSVDGVRHIQARYLKEGDALFRLPGRGGDRRHLLSRREERALLQRVRNEAQPFGVVDFRTIHAEVEKAVGRPVPPSTVHRMLDRNGWGRQTLALIPDRTNPTRRPKGARRPRSGAWQPISAAADEETPASSPPPSEPEPPSAPQPPSVSAESAPVPPQSPREFGP
jgi:transposase